jgi:hypothetical protein
MLEYQGVERNIKLFIERFGYSSCPAQPLFIEVAGEGPGSKALPGKIYSISPP